MPKARRSPRLTIDHREIRFRPGSTVLEAAREGGVDIPTLCWHEGLSPHGGCRLCLVEIEGLPGYPLACTTRAEPEMHVLTDTGALRDLRREILQLLLSRHPSSCFACDERESCALAHGTIRKAGVPTGCRFCPNDGQCELQVLVERLGVKDLEYPITYAGYEPEHDDPFFDRDYNLCVLCGRCVRVCQEVRCANVLSFQNRGPETRVGPSFGRDHADTDCEFCGACVSVCPTGALFEKGSKWDGKPDEEVVSTCPFCGVGCSVVLHRKRGRLSWVDGHRDPDVNDGQLCVRGRFCLPEATHHHERMRKPHLRRDPYFRQVTWDAALGEVADRLRDVEPEDFLLVASADLTNESLWVAQRFVRRAMGSTGIDSTARAALPGGLGLWSSLFSRSISLGALGRADTVLVVGLDRRFSLSVVMVRIRQAMRRGARLVTVSAHDSALSREAHHPLRAAPGEEPAVLDLLSRRLAGERPADEAEILKRAGLRPADFEAALLTLGGGDRRSVVIGPQAFAYDRPGRIGDAVERLVRFGYGNVVPLYFGANARGVLELGALAELEPGGALVEPRGPSLADVVAGRSRPRVLYLVGETPFLERPDVEFIVAQDLYPPPFPVDAFLPAASFAETAGTLTNLEGRVGEVHPVEIPAEPERFEAQRPDWAILAELARRLGQRGFRYRDWRAVLREVRREVPTFPSRPTRRPRPLAFRLPVPAPEPAADAPAPRRSRFVLTARPSGFRHRGVDLATKVEGLGELALEEGFCLNPLDAESLGVASGDSLVVKVIGRGGPTATGKVRTEEACPRGVVEFWKPSAFGGLVHRNGLSSLYGLEANPVAIRVRKEEPACSP